MKIVILLLLFFGLTAYAGVSQQQNDGIARISIEELKGKIDKHEDVVVVDVRNNPSVMIKGAVNIPLDQMEKRFGEIPKDKLVVTVCSCATEGSSIQAMRILQSKGYTKLAALKGGQTAWETAKYPTENVKESNH